MKSAIKLVKDENKNPVICCHIYKLMVLEKDKYRDNHFFKKLCGIFLIYLSHVATEGC